MLLAFRVDESEQSLYFQFMELAISGKRQELFWKNVTKSDGCWTWNRRKDEDGYGRVTLNGITVQAHRVSFVLSNGSKDGIFRFPKGLCVCHSCDNPPCVNPDHLFLGTHRDNKIDSFRKNRSNNEHLRFWWKSDKRGEANPSRKLGNKDVIAIRKLSSENHLPQRKIAKCFGVSQALIGQILRRENWTHI